MLYATRKKAKYLEGFSILETLIAIFILAFSLLALAGLITKAWKRTYDAHLVSLAACELTNRAEAFYVGEKDEGQYHALWQKNVSINLPSGNGRFVSKGSKAQIEVCWRRVFRGNNFCYKLDL